MREALLAATFAWVAVTAEAAASCTASWDHTRSLSKPTASLVCVAAKSSPLVRVLLDAIEQSDVIVYVGVLTEPYDAQVRGGTRFAVQAGGIRYLRVEVEGHRRSLADQIATLGHELCHVLEVARSPQVKDRASFSRLYQDIGVEWKKNHFETEDARAVERQVMVEVAGGRSAQGMPTWTLKGPPDGGPAAGPARRQ